jgi:recombination protein RecR
MKTTMEALVDSFVQLPGIGRKSAARIANYLLLKADTPFMERFSEQIATLQQKIRPCSICGAYTEEDPCPICRDPLRDKTLLCVVEQPQDVAIIDASKEYTGLFHVLGGLIAPLEGIGPDSLNLGRLVKRVREEGFTEVILATNPTVEGDTTALYIQSLLAGTKVTVTRLASGLPVGGDLEYADRLTLSRSFRGRTAL